MRILLLRGGALGDFVVTLPAIGLLRERWPHARIELVGNPAAAALGLRSMSRRAESNDVASTVPPYLDAVHAQSEARWSRLGSGGLDDEEKKGKVGEFAAWLTNFDLVVNFWPDADGSIAADFATLGFVTPCDPGWQAGEPAGARRFLCANAVPQIAPAAVHFCAALAPLGLTTEDFRARVFPGDEDSAVANALLDTRHAAALIALHPGSGSPKKSWPLDRWLAVIDALRAEKSFRLVVLLGEVEQAAMWAAEIEKRFPPDTFVLCSLATPVLAAVLQRCSHFLGHDSGPAHVAAAVGCPCVLVFGPTDPAMWAPPGDHVRIVRCGNATTDVSVDDVIDAARLSSTTPLAAR